ncbi:MAG: lipopolysaccharide biosynthesis protein [Thermodesulfobacteriota bacterium]
MSSERASLAGKAFSAARYAAVYRVIAQLIGAVSTVFLVRVLSEQAYGVYNLLYSVIALLGMVFSLGIANLLQRYIPEYYGRGEYVLADRLYRSATLFRLLSNVLVLGLILLGWEYVGPLLKIGGYRQYFLLFSLIILLHMQRGILETCLSSYFLQRESQGLSIVFILIKGVGYGAALLFGWDLWKILIIDLLAYLVVFVLLQAVYWKKIPRHGGSHDRFSREERSRLSRYAFFYNFNDAGAGMLDANFDNFIIVMYLDPVAVGAYAFCNRINAMAARMLPINYLLDVIRPLFFIGNSDSDRDKVRRNFQLLTKATYMFQFPLFMFFFLLGKEFITVFFGGKFVEYAPVLTAVAFCNLVNAIQLPVGLVAQLRERADIILYSKMFALYNLVADVVLIHFLGIWGAVIATGSAVFMKNLYVWFYIRREAGFVGMGQFFTRMIGCWMMVAMVWQIADVLFERNYEIVVIGLSFIVLGVFLQIRFLHLTEWERKKLSEVRWRNRRIVRMLNFVGLELSATTER